MQTNQQPLVSVMIPYYNCGKYIAETIASVKAQHYPHIEIIIVDDGSDAVEAAVLTELVQQHPDIRLIRQENQGVSAARNQAAAHASGRYYLFLDADDMLLPDYLSATVAVLESRAEIKLVYTQAEFFDAENGPWKLPAYESLRKLLEGNHIPVTSLHRAEDFHRIGGFDNTLHTHEDWDLWIRMLEHGGHALCLERVLFRYRRRRDRSSVTNQLMSGKNCMKESWQNVYIKNSSLFCRHGLSFYDLINQVSHSRKKSRFRRWLARLKK
ncbi:glycosyltransferase family 2 protein [Neisseria dentiae]|uniref:glycosyltransferase family 2 protein n=1 Tax=Neisseria dentiae TaxID=194197 RepID=UPI0035A06234